MRPRHRRHLTRVVGLPLLALSVAVSVLGPAAPARAGTGTAVMRGALVQPSQLAGWYRSLGKTSRATVSIDTLSTLFIQEGRDEGVAGDLAFAQAMVETGYLSFSSRMPPANNNFSGLGAVDSGSSSAAFPDARTGVRAQIQHLRAYADPTVTVAALHHPLVDTRFALVTPKGRAPIWELFGNGTWASATNYATLVLGVYGSIRTYAATHPVSPFDPFATADAAVTRGFSDLLFRSPSGAELTSGAQLLAGRQVAPIGYYSALAAGEGGRFAGPVIRLYLAALGRGPDRGGLAWWTGRLRAGVPLERLAALFLASAEYRNRVGSLGDGQYVARVYLDVLGRTADASGLLYWTDRLSSGLSRAALLVGFSESAEHRLDTDWIAQAVLVYLGMLARLPLLSDLAWWRSALTAGAPVSSLVGRAWADPAFRYRIGA